jgi:hypothetical protein
MDDVRANPPERVCWCGATNPHYDESAYFGGCDGYGYRTCNCAGDSCACHHHGEVECPGCDDCEGEGDWLDEDNA